MTIIRNPLVLDPSYIPSNILFRENELRSIKEIALDPLRDGISASVHIYGRPGVGKTVTARYAILHSECSGFYVNCLSHHSVRSVLLEVISSMKRNAGVNPSISSLFHAISRLSENKGMILVLDEISNLVRYDYSGLLSLLRSGESYGMPLAVVMISTDEWHSLVPRRGKFAPLPSYSIKFQNYTSDELYRITLDRADSSLYPGTFTDDVIRMISSIASTYGSARIAIELLQKSSYIADYVSSQIVRSDDVRAANAMINPYITESKLVELKREELMILLAVCRCLSNRTVTDMPCVQMNSEIIMEGHGVLPEGRNTIYSALKKLENLGIIQSRLRGRGKMGVSKEIMLNDAPVSVLVEKIESILDRKVPY